MDTSAADITFDEAGRCSYCTEFLLHADEYLSKPVERRDAEREALVARIIENRRGKPYDCIVGVSGGVDSSWALVHAVRCGLRPLAVHMDNGWNSELAQNNIANLVRTLGVDLYTHVIDWNEYRDLQRAFFDADVIDIELLYDNALAGVNYDQARRYGLRYILSGNNSSTEGVRIPDSWFWSNKFDYRNIRRIWRRFGAGYRLKTFPGYGVGRFYFDRNIRRIAWVRFLEYCDYRKDDALAVLQRDHGYVPYPYKHYESVFTRFYQGYILPTKFGVDKRRAHFSSLIMTGQMERDEALERLRGIPYESAEHLENDIRYFLKKFDWTRDQLDEYLARPAVPHDRYGSESWKLALYQSLAGALAPVKPAFRRWLQ